MEQKLKIILEEIKYKESEELPQHIWSALVMRNKHIARIKSWAYSFVGIISLIGLVPACKMLVSDLGQSGFFEYFSLLSLGFSDIKSFLLIWKELGLSLLESLPALSIIISLSLMFVFFLSLRHVMKQIIRGHVSPSF